MRYNSDDETVFLKTGKEFIDEIYTSIGKTIDLKSLEITSLIGDSKPKSNIKNTITLDESNSFYSQILNNYYGKLQQNDTYSYTYNGNTITLNYKWFQLKNWRNYQEYDGDNARRADTIYKEHFQTGDILLYKNSNDINYTYENGTVKTKNVTKENGEYAYIYIEGVGFVGRNYGNDSIIGNEDDRNLFNYQYYDNNNLSVYSNPDNTDIKEFANYQTLLGKDCYVILRPALSTEEIRMGDLNENDQLDMGDVLLIYRHIAQKNDPRTYQSHPEWKLSDEKIFQGDLNHNNQLDIGDCLRIQRYIAATNDASVAAEHPDWLNIN